LYKIFLLPYVDHLLGSSSLELPSKNNKLEVLKIYSLRNDSFLPIRHAMQKLISIAQLTYKIPKSKTILSDINLEVGPNEFIGLLGHNGTGKTTLLDIIMGLKAAPTGKIRTMGEDPYQDKRNNKHKVSFLSQGINLKADLSINDFLSFHSLFYPNYSLKEEKYLLNVFDMEPELKIGSLSTGQQKIVQFIAGLASMPELIVIDEITAVLDPLRREVFFQQLSRFRSENNCSIILATNIAEDLIGQVNRVLFLKEKQLIEVSPNEILNIYKSQSVA
jgi:ABC-2 type transport system ATP-binding protein